MRSVLQPGEVVEAVARVHWWGVAAGIVCAATGCLMPLGAVFLSALLSELSDAHLSLVAVLVALPLGFGLLVGGSVLAARTWSHARGAEVVVTDRRVITKHGLLGLSAADLRHSQIESVSLVQGVIGRILDFGSLIVTGTGGVRVTIVGIARPVDFRQRILDAADRFRGQP